MFLNSQLPPAGKKLARQDIYHTANKTQKTKKAKRKKKKNPRDILG